MRTRLLALTTAIALLTIPAMAQVSGPHFRMNMDSVATGEAPFTGGGGTGGGGTGNSEDVTEYDENEVLAPDADPADALRLTMSEQYIFSVGDDIDIPIQHNRAPGSLTFSSFGLDDAGLAIEGEHIVGDASEPGSTPVTLGALEGSGLSGMRSLSTSSTGASTSSPLRTASFMLIVEPESDGHTYARHRYWGIRYQSTAVHSISEFTMAEMPGGENVAWGGQGYSTTVCCGFPPGNAFDGWTGSFFASNHVAGYQYLYYDLTANKKAQVVQVSLSARSGESYQFPTQGFDVVYSDDASTWKVAWNIPPTGPYASQETKTFVTPDLALNPYSPDPDAPDPYAPHRFWGLRLEATASNVFSIADLEFKAAPDGVDQTGSGTAYSTSVCCGYPPANAFDQSSSSFFAAASNNSGERIWYDFGEGGARSVTAMTMTARNESAQTPTGWTVIFSDDGVTWQDAWRVRGSNGWSGGETRSFISSQISWKPPASPSSPPESGKPYGGHRFWGIQMLSNNSNVHSLAELELAAVPYGPNIAIGGTPGSITVCCGFGPANAFDGNGGTIYAATSNSSHEKLWYDFGAGQMASITQVKVRARQGEPGQTPNRWKVIYSDDGWTWKDAWSVVTTSDWGSGEERIFISPTADLPAGTTPPEAPVSESEPYGRHRYWGYQLSPGDSSILGDAMVSLYARPDSLRLIAERTSYRTIGPISETLSGYQYVFQEFAAPTSVTKAGIQVLGNQPKNLVDGYEIVYSDDGKTWTTAWHVDHVGMFNTIGPNPHYSTSPLIQ